MDEGLTVENQRPLFSHRLATLLTAFLLGVTATVGGALTLPARAQAYSFSGQAAANYVNNWYYRYNGAYQNLNGKGGDCTNFASQAWRAGGVPFDRSGANKWYHTKHFGARGVVYYAMSPSFVRVRDFRTYWHKFGSRYIVVEGKAKLSRAYSPAFLGDAYVYDSGGNPNKPDWIHANTSVGWSSGYDMYGQHSPGKTNTDWRNWYRTRSPSERGNFLKKGHGIRVITP